MAKKITLTVFVIVLALVAALVFLSNWQTVENRAAMAASRGIEWLLKYGGNLEDPGILWAISEINKKYCDSDKLENFVQTRFREFENHPIDAAYIKLITDSGGKKPDAETIKTSGKRYDDILLNALYCRDSEWPDMQKMLENQWFSGYDLTHQFLTVLLLKKNNCAKGEKVEVALQNLATRLAEEENRSLFGDLFVERTALLEHAGYEENVEQNWIEEIIKRQNKSGSWDNLDLFGRPDDQHTTALAIWALAERFKFCPMEK